MFLHKKKQKTSLETLTYFYFQVLILLMNLVIMMSNLKILIICTERLIQKK
jgi:hypothetical protein